MHQIAVEVQEKQKYKSSSLGLNRTSAVNLKQIHELSSQQILFVDGRDTH